MTCCWINSTREDREEKRKTDVGIKGSCCGVVFQPTLDQRFCWFHMPISIPSLQTGKG